MKNRETSENLNKVNVCLSTRDSRDSGSLTATVILISLKDISLLFLFNMKIFLYVKLTEIL